MSPRDIEETDDQLDQEVEKPPLEFWEEKQRELLTSVVDYNLKTLSDLVESKTIDLSPKYQRRERWDTARKSRLIESFLMNVPVPPIFLNEDEYGHYSIIDGKQRLTAITEFYNGKLKLQDLEVFADINGSTIEELPHGLQNVLQTRPTLRAIIILRQSDKDVKFEVFQRLNTGGVSLNAQEVRNSAWPGPLNDLILELSESRTFHELLGIIKKENSTIYREMRDAEFVLRYFTFKDNWSEFKGGIKRNMDTYMYEHQHAKEPELRELRESFNNAVSVVASAFGQHAFKRWVTSNKKWQQRVVAALFDAQIFACSSFSPDQFEGKIKSVERAQIALFANPEFEKLISKATNAPSSFKKRIELTQALLNRITKR